MLTHNKATLLEKLGPYQVGQRIILKTGRRGRYQKGEMGTINQISTHRAGTTISVQLDPDGINPPYFRRFGYRPEEAKNYFKVVK